jgi:4-hydroxysphinganine ceramide fatty acyl 2-hydroxylase
MLKKLNATEQEKGLIFGNTQFEQFTKTSPTLAISFYGLIWIGFVALNYFYGSLDLWNSIGVYFFALLFWTLFEYLAHRYVFHFINESPKVQKFHRMIHGIHHEFPRDAERLIMPPVPGFGLVCILMTLFYPLMGNNSFIFMAGFINGWALYVSIHYIIHAYQPISPFKILWTHHAKHHYKQGNKAFGVSSPFWDRVFGTMPN